MLQSHVIRVRRGLEEVPFNGPLDASVRCKSNASFDHVRQALDKRGFSSFQNVTLAELSPLSSTKQRWDTEYCTCPVRCRPLSVASSDCIHTVTVPMASLRITSFS